MKKIIMVSLLAMNTLPLITAPYKSTKDALQDISVTYEKILESKNIYSMSHLLESLKSLGARLNTHIMGKQGVILGKKKAGVKLAQKIEFDNIFNIWDEMIYNTAVPSYAAVPNLINALQTLRFDRNDQKARDLLERWIDLGKDASVGSWENMLTYVEKIRSDTILDSKKKLCDIIDSYIEYNIKLIQKAFRDLK
jgi:hypothetical protein